MHCLPSPQVEVGRILRSSVNKLTKCYYVVNAHCAYLLKHVGNGTFRNPMTLQADEADVLKPLNKFV